LGIGARPPNASGETLRHHGQGQVQLEAAAGEGELAVDTRGLDHGDETPISERPVADSPAAFTRSGEGAREDPT